VSKERSKWNTDVAILRSTTWFWSLPPRLFFLLSVQYWYEQTSLSCELPNNDVRCDTVTFHIGPYEEVRVRFFFVRYFRI
jgi:hypothetical protein